MKPVPYGLDEFESHPTPPNFVIECCCNSVVEYLLGKEEVGGSIPLSSTMKEVSEYLLLSREERRAHIALDEPCSEIGGNSQEFRGLLSYYVGVKIPQKREFYLCHACNNHRCSNVRHLYWGTPKDNVQDMKDAGTYKSITESTKVKYGDAYKDVVRRAAKAGADSNKRKAVERRALLEK